MFIEQQKTQKVSSKDFVYEKAFQLSSLTPEHLNFMSKTKFALIKLKFLKDFKYYVFS